MDNNGVRRLSVSRVTPAPAPAEKVKVKLSFLDAPWVATRPVQQVFQYDRAGGGEEEFAAVVKRLWESLAAALALYLPLTGKLVYVEETRDVVVDCSDPGVAFFVAEATAAGDEVEAESLLPELDARVLPAPIMTVQATRLNDHGLALGVSVLHAVVDGRAFVLFLDAWFSISRGGSPMAVLMPDYDRDAVARAHPGGDELVRHVLSKVAPNLPVAMVTEGNFTRNSRLGRQTIVMDADDIRRLKRHIDALALSSTSTNTKAASVKPVSTFVALCALSWTAFVHAKGLAAGDDTHLLFQIDLRARLRPPVAAGWYFGNCVRGCVASADAGELLGEAGLLRAARAIAAALREVTAAAAPVAGMGAWIERITDLPAARVVTVGGSPLFRLYQTPDFGLGVPDRVVPVYMPGSPETPGHGGDDDGVGGRVVLSGGRRDGDVHLSVSLDPVVVVDAFKNHVRSSASTIRLSKL